MSEAPTRVSDRVHRLNIDGYLMAVDAEAQPVLLAMPGTEDRFVAIFSSPDKLDALYRASGVPYTRVQQIVDGPEFLESLAENILPFRLRVAVDLRRMENGRVRFLEIPLSELEGPGAA